MKMKKKRFIAFALLFFTLISLFVFPSDAAKAEQWGENLFWEYEPRKQMLTIRGPGEMAGDAGSSYPWKKLASEVKSLVICDGVTSLSAFSFSGFEKLTSVSLPSSLERIEADAFFNCSSLSSITVPENVTVVSDLCFAGCSSLISVNVSPKNKVYLSEDGIVYSKDHSVLIYYPEGRREEFFAVPDTVKTIGPFSFYGNSKVTSIDLNRTETIESYAFDNCSGLVSCRLPETLTRISYRAFTDCISLTELNVPESVVEFGKGAVMGCTSLARLSFENYKKLLPENSEGFFDFDLSSPTFNAQYFKIDGECDIRIYYTAEFFADGKSVAKVYYTTSPKVPEVPEKSGYAGEWENYYSRLRSEEYIVINAIYTCLHPEEFSEYVPEQPASESAEGYTEGLYCTLCQKFSVGHAVIPMLEPTVSTETPTLSPTEFPTVETGTPVTTSDLPETPSETETDTPDVSSIAEPASSPSPTGSSRQEKPSDDPSDEEKSNVLPIVLSVSGALAIIGAAVFILIRKKHS